MQNPDNVEFDEKAETSIPSNWDPNREPIEEIAENFAERYRQGDRPSIDEYCRRYPEIEAEIRELFPSIVAIERMHDRKRSSGRKAATPVTPLEQLGDFRVIGEIARGGMGIVYEAEQVTLGRRVAVKVLPKDSLRSDKDVKRFQREAQTAAKLHHTNIVPVFGVGHHEGTHYIVMQLISGVGLDEILTEIKSIVFGRDAAKASANESDRSNTIKRNAISLLGEENSRVSSVAATVAHQDLETLQTQQPKNARSKRNHAAALLQPSEQNSTRQDLIRRSLGYSYYQNIARIGRQAANGLSYAHSQETLHRDVKPGNLILDDKGIVWVADFGIAKAFEENNDVTWTGDIVGTLSYMAPERFKGEADTRSDIYSLGLTLYELATLERAYGGTDRVSVIRRVENEEIRSPRKINPKIPRDLETIILKATSRNPSDRYESADDMAFDLDCFLQNQPIRARRLGVVEQFTRWCANNRAVASLTAAVFVLLFTVIGVTALGLVRETAQRQRVESHAKLALTALDEIYEQFAPQHLQTIATSPDDATEQDALLSTRGRMPLSKDVALLLENLLGFYDDLARQSDDNPSVAIKSIQANRRVGDIQQRLGDLDKAQAAYERTLELISQLDPTSSKHEDVRLEFARAQNGIGIVFNDKHLPNEAAKALRLALEGLNSETTSHTEKYEIARNLFLLHEAEKTCRHRRGRSGSRCPTEHLEQAISMLKSMPKVADYQFLLAKCHLALSHVKRSVSEEQNGCKILEELVKAHPQAADYQYELGDVYVSMVWRRLYWRRNDDHQKEPLAESEKRMRHAFEVTADLDLIHPNIPEHHKLKARMHYILARLLEEMERLDESEVHYDRAIEKQALVVRQAREKASHQYWLYRFELDRSKLHRTAQRYDVALKHLESIAKRLEDSIRTPEFQNDSSTRGRAEKILDLTYYALADVLRKTNQQDEAEAAHRKAERRCQ